MKYQTGSHDGIISFTLNGRGKSVHVQDDKVFVCDTDSKRKKKAKGDIILIIVIRLRLYTKQVIFLANADLQRYQRLKIAYLQWFR